MNVNCAFMEMRDLVNLVPNPKNYNQHSQRQIDMLAKIMNFQGWRHPIIVSKRSGFIVAGHGRLMAAKKLGWEKAPIDVQDFQDEATELAFLVADNKIAELAEADQQQLESIVVELGDIDHELLGLDTDILSEQPEVIEHEGVDNLKVTILECPHCNKPFEQAQAKVIG